MPPDIFYACQYRNGRAAMMLIHAQEKPKTYFVSKREPIIGNSFYLPDRLSKDDHETRMFKSQADANRWLAKENETHVNQLIYDIGRAAGQSSQFGAAFQITETTVHLYASLTGMADFMPDEQETVVTDLLADLRFYCDRNDLPFEDMLTIAASHDE